MASIAVFQGYTLKTIWDEMTWPDYLILNKFWKDWAPPAVSLAILAKIAPKSEEEQSALPKPPGEVDQEMLNSLYSMIGPPPQG